MKDNASHHNGLHPDVSIQFFLDTCTRGRHPVYKAWKLHLAPYRAATEASLHAANIGDHITLLDGSH